MKLVICEGLDRTGKNTVISRLSEYAENSIIRHFSKPPGSTNIEKEIFQRTDFKKEFAKYIALNDSLERGKNDMWIFNRSHIGEYVYGPLYRGTDPSWVNELEKFLPLDDTYLITLVGDPQFLASNGDGESLAEESNKETEKLALSIRNEYDAFIDATKQSRIPENQKIIIDVTHNGQYRSKDQIFKEIKEFLNI